MSEIIVYAIPNCNTVKKAIDWLHKNKIAFTFYDYKKLGITSKQLTSWSKQVGWESLINKKGTTWKQLDPTIQATITNQTKAVGLMQEKTSMIRRPLIEKEGQVLLLGFDETEYKKALK
jgi:Spx/MgsR family transcriptional regulator